MKFHALQHRDRHGWSGPLPTWLDSPHTLVLAFGATDGPAPQAALAELARAMPQSQHLGCSTAGAISGEAVRDDRLSLQVVRFEHAPLRRATAEVSAPADSRAAGFSLARQLAEPEHGQPLNTVLLVGDGLQIDGHALLDGLQSGLPPGCSVSGGLAADGARFGRTWVLEDGQCHSHRAAAVGLYGRHLKVGHGCGGGWAEFGPKRRITRAEGHVLHELDGQPALALYKTYLGERAAGLPGTALLFPLELRDGPNDAEPRMRTVMGVDEARQALLFATPLPAHGQAQLMRASSDRLVDGARRAARAALAPLPPQAQTLLLSFSCVGRRVVLGERADDEVEAVLHEAAGRGVQAGFFGCGEFAPPRPGRPSEWHNQTLSVTAIAEC